MKPTPMTETPMKKVIRGFAVARSQTKLTALGTTVPASESRPAIVTVVSVVRIPPFILMSVLLWVQE